MTRATHRESPARPRRQQGFTLIEILAAFAVMTTLLLLATQIFTADGRQREAATIAMRERLSAVSALDLIARDLEAAVHVAREQGQAPEDHPWRFTTEGSGDQGALALRFTTQNVLMKESAENASSWAEVAYFLERDEDDRLVLWRWLAARPPSESEAPFPDSGDEGAMRVAVDVGQFGVRFLDDAGAWIDEWDSTFSAPEQAVPTAVQISISLYRDARAEEAVATGETRLEGQVYMRQVTIPMRPLDVAYLISLGREDAGPECFTISACLQQGDTAWYDDQLADNCDGNSDLCDLLLAPDTTCWEDIESGYASLAATAPAECAP